MKKTLLRHLLMASCFAMLAGCTFSEMGFESQWNENVR